MEDFLCEISCGECGHFLGGKFGPETKKKLAPTPPRESHPLSRDVCTLLRNPPPSPFFIKSTPPPLFASDSSSPSPPPNQKKQLNISETSAKLFLDIQGRKSGFLKRALAQTCFRAWYQVRFLRRIFGHSWGLVYGEGGAPGTVPLHNLRVTSHVLHQKVPLGWYRVRLF